MNRLWQNVQSTRFVVLFILAFFIFSGNSIAQGADGKALFRANCASCHKASEENSTGPGLQGVLGRIPGGNWKYDWVHNSSKVIASGDPYATTLYAKYKTQMTPFPNLTNEQIDAILAYANKGEVKPAVNASGEDIGAGNAGQKGKDAAIPWFMITIIVIVLIAFIAILRYTRINLSNVVREREGLPEQPALPFFEASRVWVNNNKKIVAAIGVFLICVLVVKGWYGLKGVGVYAEEVHPDEWVGYHPSQPINFSHKIHAGDNGIQCQYCHATVEK
jgi:cytochrome c2